MKISYCVGFVILLFTFFSCADNRALQAEMEGFTGRQVVLPAAMTPDSADFFNAENKLIIWFDSTECGSCRMSRLYEWDDDPVMQYARGMGDRFNVFLVFSPKATDIRSLKFSLESYDVSFPVLIDETGEFLKQNPHIPANTRLHSFLLDKNNRVILIGNPLGNGPLWELYKEQIRALINTRE